MRITVAAWAATGLLLACSTRPAPPGPDSTAPAGAADHTVSKSLAAITWWRGLVTADSASVVSRPRLECPMPVLGANGNLPLPPRAPVQWYQTVPMPTIPPGCTNPLFRADTTGRR